jgi:hypothetical protein
MKRRRASVKAKPLTGAPVAANSQVWHGHSRKEALQEMRRQIQQMREEIKRAKRAANPR